MCVLVAAAPLIINAASFGTGGDAAQSHSALSRLHSRAPPNHKNDTSTRPSQITLSLSHSILYDAYGNGTMFV